MQVHTEKVVIFQVALDYLQGGKENTRDREQMQWETWKRRYTTLYEGKLVQRQYSQN